VKQLTVVRHEELIEVRERKAEGGGGRMAKGRRTNGEER